MSWNDCLYSYYTQRGGTYFGSDGAEFDGGTLLLEDRRGPMLIRTQYHPSAGRGYSEFFQVRLVVRLERPYRLRIGPKRGMSQGVNMVLGALDAGLSFLPSGPDFYEDYGCPEVTRGRLIRTSDRVFTQMVFRDLELRRHLLEGGPNRVEILPLAPGETLHQVMAYIENGLTCDWQLGSGAPMPQPEAEHGSCTVADGFSRADGAYPESGKGALEESFYQCNFVQRLDGLVALAQAAGDAVTAYRMA